LSALVPPESKVFGAHDLLFRFGRPRTGRVVFTNGCFDLLHRGHVEYLYAARSLGETLVVGLNSDRSVRRLKGHDRPLVSEEDRAIILAGLACVDAVTLFDDDTPRDLIAALLPDVLVKGGDYAAEDVIGGREVESAGGSIRIIPFLDGRSTTGLVRRIREEIP